MLPNQTEYALLFGFRNDLSDNGDIKLVLFAGLDQFCNSGCRDDFVTCSFEDHLASLDEDFVYPGTENEGHRRTSLLMGKSVPKLDNVTACVKVLSVVTQGNGD